MKRAAIDHPKLVDLCDRLQVPLYQAVGILETVWHFTAKFTPAGDVGRYSDEALARFMQWPGDAQQLVSCLVDVHWLDVSDAHRLIVHDWPEHAEDSVHMSLARAGKLFADGNRPKTNRLSKLERAHAEELLVRTASARRAHGKRTESARRAHQKRTAIPSPAIPSPPPPEEIHDDEETRAEKSQSGELVEYLRSHSFFSEILDPALFAHSMHEGYPDVDLLAQSKKAAAWLLTGKTDKSAGKFLQGWFGRTDAEIVARANGNGQHTESGPRASSRTAAEVSMENNRKFREMRQKQREEVA
jgi:hypothetical protein